MVLRTVLDLGKDLCVRDQTQQTTHVLLKQVPEICHIFCATANPVEVLVVETELGRGIIGVVDGASPLGVETDEDAAARHELLRTIGYKLELWRLRLGTVLALLRALFRLTRR